MTTPIPDLPMPYGATLVPTTGQNANYLDVATKGNVKVVGATGIYVPKGVFHLRVSWPGPNALSLMRNFTDGTLRTQHTIIPAGGGSYYSTLSGHNLSFLQFLTTAQDIAVAAGSRGTVELIPVPDPQ